MNLRKVISCAVAFATALLVFTYQPGGIVKADNTDGTIPIDEAHFPDPVFRQYILDHFDSVDHNGFLNAKEIEEAKYLIIYSKDVTSLEGVKLLPNLVEIDVWGSELTSLDVSGMTKLKKLTVSGNNLGDGELPEGQLAFDIRNCTSLEIIKAGSNLSLGNIVFENNDSITYLDIAHTGIDGVLDVSMLPNLKDLYCGNNNITQIILNENADLEYIQCYSNLLTSLDLSGMNSLLSVDCSKNRLEDLDVSDCPSLIYLNVEINNLTSLDLTGHSALEYLFMENNFLSGSFVIPSDVSCLRQLDCSYNDLTGIDVGNCPALEYLKCSDMELASLDVSHNPNLVILNCGYNVLTQLDLSQNASLAYLVANDNNIEELDIRNNDQLLDAYNNGDQGNGIAMDYTQAFPENMSEYYVMSTTLARYLSGGKKVDQFRLKFDQETFLIHDDASAAEAEARHAGTSGGSSSSGGSSFGGSSSGSSSSSSGSSGSGSSSGGSNSGSGSSGSGFSSTPAPTSRPSTPAPSSGSGSSSSGNSSSGGPAPAQTFEPGVGGFVDRLYVIALDRDSDPAGRADWIAAITERGNTGADAARGFLYSSEFLNKQVTNEDFVRVLYRTFFDREPDTDGFNAWVNALNSGASKQDVIEGFINSTEWANLCLLYGIASGGTGVPNIEIEPNQATVDFCTRLYTTCLGREADRDGLMAWARQLANRRDSGSGAARGFFFSSEFIGQNVDNGEYVRRLYRTFMGREADEEGYNAWVAQLDEGVSREAVFAGFAESPEFTRICASYGIIR